MLLPRSGPREALLAGLRFLAGSSSILHQHGEKCVIRVTEACALLPGSGHFGLDLFKNRCYRSTLAIKSLHEVPLGKSNLKPASSSPWRMCLGNGIGCLLSRAVNSKPGPCENPSGGRR